MTLALILLVGNFLTFAPRLASLFAGVALQQASQPTPADQTSPPQDQKSASPDSKSQPPAQTPSGTKSGQPTAGQPSAKKHVVHKKKTSDCTPAPTGQSTSAASATGGTSADASHSQASAPANCPPPKVTVDQGSTKETSIQLVGGPAGIQAVSERNTATEKLATAEANLKKTADWQLTASQKDMVSQIRQFMDQSRQALQAGDSERASTLAGKAQQLSEELVKPAKP